MKRNSLRARVTTFYVGMLAIALLIFSAALYFGVKAFLTKSIERVLSNSAHSIINDYVVPLDQKGESWLVEEMSESYPPGYSEPFVRVSQGPGILYQSGDMRDPFVSTSKLPLPSNPEVVQYLSSRNSDDRTTDCSVHCSVSRSERISHLCRDRSDARTHSTRTPQPSAYYGHRDAYYFGRRCHWRIPANVAALATRRRPDGAGRTM